MINRARMTLMNGIIAQVYTNPDFKQMRTNVLDMLRTLVPSASITFYLAEEGGSVKCADPVCVGIFENEPLDEYVELYQDKDPSKWLFTNGKSNVYRESDYFSEEVLRTSDYIKNIYVPNEIRDTLQVSIGKNNVFLGVITFFRKKDEKDFLDEEIELLEMLVEHFENRLYYEIVDKPSGAVNLSYSVGENTRKIDDYNSIRNTLTKREKEIFDLLIEGLSIEELKEACCISESTLRKHIQNIYQKPFGTIKSPTSKNDNSQGFFLNTY